jgi:HEPN domain-containing protein
VPPEHDIARQWIRLGEHDFREAQRGLAELEDPAYEIICFHAQQAAEKYLKAFLCSKKIKVPNTHDLVNLARLLPKESPLNDMIDDLAHLTPYAVSSRYPGVDIPETRADADFAIRVARRVREVVLPPPAQP